MAAEVLDIEIIPTSEVFQDYVNALDAVNAAFLAGEDEFILSSGVDFFIAILDMSFQLLVNLDFTILLGFLLH